MAAVRYVSRPGNVIVDFCAGGVSDCGKCGTWFQKWILLSPTPVEILGIGLSLHVVEVMLMEERSIYVAYAFELHVFMTEQSVYVLRAYGHGLPIYKMTCQLFPIANCNMEIPVLLWGHSSSKANFIDWSVKSCRPYVFPFQGHVGILAAYLLPKCQVSQWIWLQMTKLLRS